MGGCSQLAARELMEPLVASKLRLAGWKLPGAVPDTYVLRVYDSRLDMTWLRQLLGETGLGSQLFVVGGDFMTTPYREDAVALQSGRLERWGPPGDGPYHLVVPPRPHLAVWMQRVRQQLAMEAPGTWVTLCAVVPRDRCPQQWDLPALGRALPQAECLVNDPNLEVRVVALANGPQWFVSQQMCWSCHLQGGIPPCCVARGCCYLSMYAGGWALEPLCSAAGFGVHHLHLQSRTLSYCAWSMCCRQQPGRRLGRRPCGLASGPWPRLLDSRAQTLHRYGKCRWPMGWCMPCWGCHVRRLGAGCVAAVVGVYLFDHFGHHPLGLQWLGLSSSCCGYVGGWRLRPRCGTPCRP